MKFGFSRLLTGELDLSPGCCVMGCGVLLPIPHTTLDKVGDSIRKVHDIATEPPLCCPIGGRPQEAASQEFALPEIAPQGLDFQKVGFQEVLRKDSWGEASQRYCGRVAVTRTELLPAQVLASPSPFRCTRLELFSFCSLDHISPQPSRFPVIGEQILTAVTGHGIHPTTEVTTLPTHVIQFSPNHFVEQIINLPSASESIVHSSYLFDRARPWSNLSHPSYPNVQHGDHNSQRPSIPGSFFHRCK